MGFSPAVADNKKYPQFTIYITSVYDRLCRLFNGKVKIALIWDKENEKNFIFVCR